MQLILPVNDAENGGSTGAIVGCEGGQEPGAIPPVEVIGPAMDHDSTMYTQGSFAAILDR